MSKTIPNYINVDTTPKRVTTRDKVIKSLKKNKSGMSLIAIGEDADISSQGNLHAVMKMMLRRGEVTLALPHTVATPRTVIDYLQVPKRFETILANMIRTLSSENESL